MDENENLEEDTTKFDKCIDNLSKIDLRKRINSITFLSLIFSILFLSLTFYLLTTKVQLVVKGTAILKEKNEKKTHFSRSYKT